MSANCIGGLTWYVKRGAVLAAAAALLAACGTDPNDRTEGGAASGAATGATVGLIGGPIGVVVGAVIGGGAGALTGAVTGPQTVDLGTPPWSDKPDNGDKLMAGNMAPAAPDANAPAPDANGAAGGSGVIANGPAGAPDGGRDVTATPLAPPGK